MVTNGRKNRRCSRTSTGDDDANKPAWVAQSVERVTLTFPSQDLDHLKVVGSSPTSGSIPECSLEESSIFFGLFGLFGLLFAHSVVMRHMGIFLVGGLGDMVLCLAGLFEFKNSAFNIVYSPRQ